jgi:hypothetical protein
MFQLLSLLRALKNNNIKLFVYNIIFVLVFSVIYYFAHHHIEEGFGKYTKDNITFFDTLHFSFVTQTTNGYGDMYITSQFLKLVNMFHLLALLSINLFI